MLGPDERHGHREHATNFTKVLYVGEPSELTPRQEISGSSKREDPIGLQEGDAVELHMDAPAIQHDEADAALQEVARVLVGQLRDAGEDLGLVRVVVGPTSLVACEERNLGERQAFVRSSDAIIRARRLLPSGVRRSQSEEGALVVEGPLVVL